MLLADYGDLKLLEQCVPAQMKLLLGDAKDVICETVEKLQADLLITGSHGYGAIKRVNIFFKDKRRAAQRLFPIHCAALWWHASEPPATCHKFLSGQPFLCQQILLQYFGNLALETMSKTTAAAKGVIPDICFPSYLPPIRLSFVIVLLILGACSMFIFDDRNVPLKV
eukprot:Gb_37410 [translate_table: standard]